MHFLPRHMNELKQHLFLWLYKAILLHCEQYRSANSIRTSRIVRSKRQKVSISISPGSKVYLSSLERNWHGFDLLHQWKWPYPPSYPHHTRIPHWGHWTECNTFLPRRLPFIIKVLWGGIILYVHVGSLERIFSCKMCLPSRVKELQRALHFWILNCLPPAWRHDQWKKLIKAFFLNNFNEFYLFGLPCACKRGEGGRVKYLHKVQCTIAHGHATVFYFLTGKSSTHFL